MPRSFRSRAAVAVVLGLALLAAGGTSTSVTSAAAPESGTGRIIVQLKPGTSSTALRGIIQARGARVDRELGNGRAIRIQAPAGTDLPGLLAALRADPSVAKAGPDLVARAFDLPNDAGFPAQWDLLAGPGGIDAPGAWEQSPARGQGVVVAVIDTGVAYENFSGGQGLFGPKTFGMAPDLAGIPIVAPWDWIDGDSHAGDENGHGTHVAGTILEGNNNGLAESGISAASLMPLRILDFAGNGSASDLIDALYYAADHGAKVINLSLGFAGTGAPGPDGQVCEEIVGLAEALQYDDAMGVTVVAASGNEGATTVSCPAAYPTVIAVGATDLEGAVTFYSNSGAALALTAPGGDPNADLDGNGQADQIVQQTYCLDALTLFLSGRFNVFCDMPFSGTSMASPHVAGTVALLLGQHPTLSPAQARVILQETARDGGTPGWDPQFGAGIVDASAAMASIIADPPPPPPSGPPPVPRPTPQPGATNVSANAVDATHIQISWFDSAANETGFRIDRSLDNGATWSQAGTVKAGITTYLNGSLQAGTQYWYRVRSYDSLGSSPWSDVVSATTLPPPSAPENPSAVPLTASSVRVTWTDTSNSEQGFKIERSTDGVTFNATSTAGENATSATVSSLLPATTYWFRIRGYDGSVMGPASPVVQAETLDVPSAPTGLTATTVDTTSIRLDWIDTSTTEQGFKVERSADGGVTWTTVSSRPANSVSYTNGSLTPGTQYSFRVRGYDGPQLGDPSNVATAQTLPPPAAPSGLAAAAVNTTKVNLSWTDNSSFEQGFRIERSVDGGLTWLSSGSAGDNETAHTVTNLVPGTAYLFRLRAYEGSTNGDYSNSASASTFAPPDAPLNLNGAGVGSTKITLTWTNASSYQTGMKIERSLDGLNWAQVGTASSTATSWSNTNLSPATAYQYRLRAIESSTNGPYSDPVTVATLAPPLAPGNVTATQVSATSVRIAWTDTCGYETGFKVERSLDGATWTQVGSTGANATNSTNSGLSPHTTYLYRVRAVDGSVGGDPSAVVIYTTP
jgi:subtilisin family serine protease